jgi:hypothetical protein
MIEPAASQRPALYPAETPIGGGWDYVRETPGFIQQRCSNRARPCRTRSTRAGLYAGLANRTDRRAAIAAAVIASESLIFAATGFRCPLTIVAESLGAEHGSVTDLYLPAGFARNRPAIRVPLLAWALFLHGRNLRRSFRAAPLVASAQLRRQAGSPRVTAGDRGFPGVLPQMWHGRRGLVEVVAEGLGA